MRRDGMENIIATVKISGKISREKLTAQIDQMQDKFKYGVSDTMKYVKIC